MSFPKIFPQPCFENKPSVYHSAHSPSIHQLPYMLHCLPHLSLDFNWWFQFVEINFLSLKLNMKHGRFVVKVLIILCMFTFCVEVELVRLIVNIVGSLIYLCKIIITKLFWPAFDIASDLLYTITLLGRHYCVNR